MSNLFKATGSGARCRILLADDHPMILDGLIRMLEPEFAVVGQAGSGQEALEMGQRLRPDLAIVDINLPDFDGLELTRRLLSRLPKLKVLIFSIHQDAARVRAAFAAGAAGYLSKTSAAAEIETAVRELIAGNGWVSPTVARAVLQPTPPPVLHQGAANRPAAQTKNVAVRGDGLTPREIEILDLLALSLGNKEMAQHLGVSVTTVRTHLSSIYEKLGVDSRVSLALYAAQLHLSAS